MAAWILAALKMIAQGTALGGGFELGQRILGDGTFDLGGGGGPGLLPIGRGRVGRVIDQAGNVIREGGVRRRRRRALTASDRADIAFIAGMISKAAAKDFAVQLAARPR